LPLVKNKKISFDIVESRPYKRFRTTNTKMTIDVMNEYNFNNKTFSLVENSENGKVNPETILNTNKGEN
jgi:hypothetical protein